MTEFNSAAEQQIGRPVRVVSIAFKPNVPLEHVAEMVDLEGARGTDLIVLPETFLGQNEATIEPLSGRTIQTIGGLAKKHRTYVVCPVDRCQGNQRFNSAVVLDRSGEIVCIYDKMYLYYEEYGKPPPVQPGERASAFSTDFGRVGLAICFDVNWPDLWKELSDQGAELVIWPSAYSAGRALQAHAINHHYYVVSATWTPDCRVYDIDGAEMSHGSDTGQHGAHVTRIILDLDRCIFHYNVNAPGKLRRLLEDHGDDVEQEKALPLESWFVLRAKRPGVSARELARKYGLEELTHYINRSDLEIDALRKASSATAGHVAACTAQDSRYRS